MRGQGDERRSSWTPVDSELPPLLLEVAGRTVPISEGYQLTLLGSDPVLMSNEEPTPGVSERWEGLRAGQPVVALGHIEEGPHRLFGGRYLETRRLISGTRAGTLTDERSSSLFGFAAAVFLTLAGLAILALAAR